MGSFLVKKHPRPSSQSPRASPAHAHTTAHHTHSPMFYAWELITLSCVFFVAEAFFGHPFIHVDTETEHILELAVEGAEVILIAEVALLLIVARDKVSHIKRNWCNILAVAPVGGSLRIVTIIKITWHAFEKTRLGHFFKHPIQYSRRWIRVKLGLRPLA